MKSKLFILSLMAFLAHETRAQGCSDAGFCSIVGSQGTPNVNYRNRLELGYVYAAGEADVTIHSQQLGYRRSLGQRWAASLKGTMATSQGSFGTRGFPGDVYLTGFYRLSKPEQTDKKWAWNALLGIKAPLTNANLKINEHPLPMVYQSSLGTGDVIAGLNAEHQHWVLDAALQLPVLNLNRNAYFSELSGTDKFPTTNLFERRPDVLLRATWKYTSPNEKLLLRPNLMAILHLGDDTYEDATGMRRTIDGSSGLTLNWNLLTTYFLHPHHGLELSVASPLVARDARPDGLTRAFTAGLAYIARW